MIFRFCCCCCCCCWKITGKKLLISDTATIRRVQRASVDSRWHLGLLVCTSAFLKVRKHRISTRHWNLTPTAMLQLVQNRTIPRLSHSPQCSHLQHGLPQGMAGWWLSSGMKERLEGSATEPASVLWLSNSSPPLHYHYKQATVRVFLTIWVEQSHLSA